MIYTTGIEYNPTWPYKKRKWFNKEQNFAGKTVEKGRSSAVE